jgi:hypothetical protein
MFRNLIQFVLPFSLLSCISAQAQNITVSPGNLLLSFYQVTEPPTGVEGNTFVYNLGASSTWRDTTASEVLIANLDADLTTAFGNADWKEDGRIRMLAVGVVSVDDTPVGGDPLRTVYFSQAKQSFMPYTQPTWRWQSSTLRATISLQASQFTTAMNNQPRDGAILNGAFVSTAITNDVTEKVPPFNNTSFGASQTPNTSFGAGTIGSGGSYAVEAALDVFRILNNTGGATLTSNKTTGNAVVGTPQFIGTFTIASNGDLRYHVPVATQTPYEAWATQNGLSGAAAAVSADPDGDGILNGVEFVIGGAPNSAVDSAKLPIIEQSGGNVIFRFRRTDAGASLNPVVETDSDLQGPWTTAVNGQAGVTITVEPDFFNASTDRVSVSLPAADPRKFARLRVSAP